MKAIASNVLAGMVLAALPNIIEAVDDDRSLLDLVPANCFLTCLPGRSVEKYDIVQTLSNMECFGGDNNKWCLWEGLPEVHAGFVSLSAVFCNLMFS